jgi:transglutaminase-like putative cysteine protease
MLRSIGIPARLATGFAPGQFNPFTGFYVVQNTDAYAITEVFSLVTVGTLSILSRATN